jgi:transcriptional regulator with AAA-type ATPase domain
MLMPKLVTADVKVVGLPDLRSGQIKGLRPEPAEGQPAFRFHWNSPLIGSRHAKGTMYLAGNRVFELTDHGEKWRPISPDLSTRDLARMVTEGTFREDLYYRLNVFPIRVPPLRERTEDIPMLVWRFVGDFSVAFGKRVESIPKDNMEMLQRYAWPGNVRELRNLVERAVIGASGPSLTITLPQPSAGAARRSVRLADVEREHIKGVLDSTRWRVRGVGGAADQLGLKATTLETRMAKLGLQRPRH